MSRWIVLRAARLTTQLPALIALIVVMLGMAPTASGAASDRYWVGGTGSWNNTANWSTSSGGTGGATVPGASSAVFFTAASGTGVATMDTNYSIDSLTCTGYTGTLADGGFTLTVAGNATFVSGMTLTATGTLAMNSSSTLTTGGKTLNNLSSTAGTLVFGDNAILAGSLSKTGGTLNFNGRTIRLIGAARSHTLAGSTCSNSATSTLRYEGAGSTMILPGTTSAAVETPRVDAQASVTLDRATVGTCYPGTDNGCWVTVAAGATLTLAANLTLQATIPTFSGGGPTSVIAGPGTFSWTSTTDFPTPATATFSCNVVLRPSANPSSFALPTGHTLGSLTPTNNNFDLQVTMGAATTVTNNFTMAANISGSSGYLRTVQPASSTLTIGGNLNYTNASGTGAVAINHTANAFTCAVAGNIDFADTDGAVTVNLGAGTWQVGGTSIDFTGADTLNHNNGTVELTRTSGTTTVISASKLLHLLKLSGGATTSLSGTASVDALTIESTGATTVSGSALTLRSGTLSRSDASGTDGAHTVASNVTLGANGTWSNASTDNQLTVSGVVSGAFGITKQGAGTTVLSGTNTYSGTTSVSAGTLIVTGSQSSSAVSIAGGTLRGTGTVGAITSTSGTLAPGTAASYVSLKTTTANLSGCGTTIRVAGYTAGINYDRLACTGALTLGGSSALTLDLSGLNTTGTATGVITCSGSPSGTFTSVTVTNNPNDYEVEVTYASGAVSVVISPAIIKVYWHPQGSSTDPAVAANWTTDQAGTVRITTLNTTDALRFDGTGTNNDGHCTMAADLTCARLVCTANYSGTFSDGGYTLTVNGTATFVAGMGLTATGTLTMNSGGTLTGGGKTLFNVSSTGGTLVFADDFTIAGTLTKSGGTLNYNSRTITFSGAARTHNLTGCATTDYSGTAVFNGAGSTYLFGTGDLSPKAPSLTINTDTTVNCSAFRSVETGSTSVLTLAGGRTLTLGANLVPFKVNAVAGATIVQGAGSVVAGSGIFHVTAYDGASFPSTNTTFNCPVNIQTENPTTAFTVPANHAFGNYLLMTPRFNGVIQFLGGFSTVGRFDLNPGYFDASVSRTMQVTFAGASTVNIGGNMAYGPGDWISHTVNFNTGAAAFDLNVAGSISWSNTFGTLNATTGAGSWRVGGLINLTGADTFAATTGHVMEMTADSGGTYTLTSGGKQLYTLKLSPTNSVSLADAASVNDLVINTANAFTLSGASAITLRSGNLTRNDVSGAEGAHVVSCPIALGANGIWTSSSTDTQVTASGVVSGAFSLAKQGAGVVVLSAANTYSGGTTVSAGSLLVNNASGSGTGSGAVSVSAGATLGGSGTISGVVSTANSAALRPGASSGAIGTLTLSAASPLTATAATTLAMDVIGAAADQLVCSAGSGVLALGNLSLNLSCTSPSAGTYTLISYPSGSISGAFASTSGVPAGYAVVVTGTAVLLTNDADGANEIWTGAGGDSDFATDANWNDNTAPGSGDHVTFPDVVNQTVTMSVPATVLTVTFTAADAYTVAGASALTLGGTVTQSGAGAVTISAPVATGNAARTLTGTGSGQVSLSGLISGSGVVTIAGGSYRFTNTANSFSDGVSLTGGLLTAQALAGDLQLSLGDTSAIGTAAVTIDGGTLRLLAAGYVKPSNDWGLGRGIQFGANGGTLDIASPLAMLINGHNSIQFATNANPATPATIRYSSIGTIDTDLTNAWDWQGRNLFYPHYSTGTGAVRLELTNGAYALLEKHTLGETTIVGHPGGLYPTPATAGPWSSVVVGAPAIAGSATADQTQTSWSVVSSGADIWGQADAFQAAGLALTGDVTVTARVLGMTDTHPWAKAGIMIRSDTTAEAAHAFLCATPGNGLVFQGRTASGDSSWNVFAGAFSPPVWLRLARFGTSVTASRSLDGQAWTVVATADVALGPSAQIMLAVTSRDDSQLCTATFSDVSVLPTGVDRATSIGRISITGPNSYPSPRTWTASDAGFVFHGTLHVQLDKGTQTIASDVTVASGTVGFFGGDDSQGDDGIFGPTIGANTFAVASGATAILDLRGQQHLTIAGGLVMNDDVALAAGATLSLRQSVSGGTVSRIAIKGDLAAQGSTADEAILDVQLLPGSGPGEADFGTPGSTGSDLIVNGSGTGGLRIQGTLARLDTASTASVVSSARLAGLSGSGGFLTIAPSDGTFTMSGGSQWAATGVGLRVINSYASGTDLALADAAATWARPILVDSGAVLGVGHASTAVAITGGIAGAGGLAKSGAGTVTLATTACTLSGPWTVSAGTLVVDVTCAGGGAVSVASAARLAGAGSIAGAVTVEDGGILAPGGSGAGTLTLTKASASALALAGTSVIEVDLGTASDLIACSGTNAALTLDGTVNISAGPGFAGGSYTIITYTGTLTDNTLVIGTLPAGYVASIDTATPGQVKVVCSAGSFTTRTTGDADLDGRIDRIRMVASGALDDDFSGFTATVAGYVVAGYDTGTTANDSEFLILLTESGSGDTGATPAVRVTANSSLRSHGGGGLYPTDVLGVTTSDAAKPILLASNFSDADANGVDVGDTITLTFSEAVSVSGMLASHLGLPVSGDTLASSTIADQGPASTITIALAGTPQLTPGGTYSALVAGAGSASGLHLADGSAVLDAVGNAGGVPGAAAAVDLGPGTAATVSVAWESGADPRTWALGTIATGATANTVSGPDLRLRNLGTGALQLLIRTSPSSPAGWTPAVAAASNAFLMKCDAAGTASAAPALPDSYALTLTTANQVLRSLLYSGTLSDFDLYFAAPSAITIGGGTVQAITVTVTAQMPP